MRITSSLSSETRAFVTKKSRCTRARGWRSYVGLRSNTCRSSGSTFFRTLVHTSISLHSASGSSSAPLCLVQIFERPLLQRSQVLRVKRSKRSWQYDRINCHSFRVEIPTIRYHKSLHNHPVFLLIHPAVPFRIFPTQSRARVESWILSCGLFSSSTTFQNNPFHISAP